MPLYPKPNPKPRPVPSSKALKEPKAAAKKPAAAKKDPAPKKTKTVPVLAKKTPLSPAAKAYAAKQAKAVGRTNHEPMSSEDEDNIGPGAKPIKANVHRPTKAAPLSSDDEALDAMADDLLVIHLPMLLRRTAMWRIRRLSW